MGGAPGINTCSGRGRKQGKGRRFQVMRDCTLGALELGAPKECSTLGGSCRLLCGPVIGCDCPTEWHEL